jgi:SAM-dependent methyltransferase
MPGPPERRVTYSFELPTIGDSYYTRRRDGYGSGYDLWRRSQETTPKLTTNPPDRWGEWLLRGRSAGLSPTLLERGQRELLAVSKRVLEGAQLQPGDVVLDAGCGTGLLTFGAAEMVGETGRVIGIDISTSALDELRRLAVEHGLADRVELRQGSVLDLPVASASVDAVVDRSVLMYVEGKGAAASEYRRVLGHGGRVSIFEPINAEARYEYGFDLDPIRELHDRVEVRKRAEWAGPSRSMVDFGADDLLRSFEVAGFGGVDLELGEFEVAITSGEDWQKSLERPPNPLWPPTIDLIREALGPDADRYVSAMAAGVDRGGYHFICPTAFIVARSGREGR